MWRRNLSAVISSSSTSPRRCHAAARIDARRSLVPGFGRRERAEVVLAEERVGRIRERLLVERARIPVAAPELEGRGRRADARCGSDSSARGPNAARGSPRPPPRPRHRRRRAGRHGVQRLGRMLGRRSALDLDARAPGRARALPCPSGPRPRAVPPREDLGKRPAQLVLDGAQARLGGPPAEVGPVVLEGQSAASFDLEGEIVHPRHADMLADARCPSRSERARARRGRARDRPAGRPRSRPRPARSTLRRR